MSITTSDEPPDRGFGKRLRHGERALAAADPALGRLMAQCGPLDGAAYPRREPFAALVAAIIGQQLSTRAAASIAARLTALCHGHVTPAALLLAGPDALRAVGVSGAKARALLGLADAVQHARLPLATLAAGRSDAQISTLLCALPGIGPWTAQMFLMFGLRRLDVYSPADLGLRKALARLDGLATLPTPLACGQRAERWRPWRTVASWHLWRSLTTPATLSARRASAP